MKLLLALKYARDKLMNPLLTATYSPPPLSCPVPPALLFPLVQAGVRAGMC